MKPDRNVISNRCIPTRLPICDSVVAWLLLDRFNAVGWVYGVVGTLGVFLWIVVIYMVLHEKPSDVPGFGEVDKK